MSQVFVSYSRADRPYVELLVQHLASVGISCWYDHGIGKGERFDRVIAEHIDSCAAMIVVMTEFANESDWVANEIAYAETKRKRIFPLLRSGTPLVSLARRDYEDVTSGAMPGPEFVAQLAAAVGDGSFEFPDTFEPEADRIVEPRRTVRESVIGTEGWVINALNVLLFPAVIAAVVAADVRGGTYSLLVCAGLLQVFGWWATRGPTYPRQVRVLDVFTVIGAAIAIALSWGSVSELAIVALGCGVLSVAAAVRRTRRPVVRRLLVEAALVSVLAASWLALYSANVALLELYTASFAVVAFIIGAIELRARPQLSSWAYGPALIGGIAPSTVLVVIGGDSFFRWVSLLGVAVVVLVVGLVRRYRAPIAAGAEVILLVIATEVVRLLAAGRIAGAAVLILLVLLSLTVATLFWRRRRAVEADALARP